MSTAFNRRDGAVHASLYALAVGAVALPAWSAAAAEVKITPPILAKNIKQICPHNELSLDAVIKWYFFNNSDFADTFKTPDDLAAALRAPDRLQGDAKKITSGIAAQLAAMKGEGLKGDFEAESFLAGASPGHAIACALPGAPSPAAGTPPDGAKPSNGFSFSNFRIRGTADTLPVVKGDAAYDAAASATISLSDNGQSKTTNNALQAAIGYDFPLEKISPNPNDPAKSSSAIDLIPFLAVDRNISDVNGKPASSDRENVSTGLVGSITTPFTGLGQASRVNVLSGSFAHIWNNIDNSRLNYIHFVEQPYMFGWLNEYYQFTLAGVRISAATIFDLRGDLGFYSDRGSKPSSNSNYQQFGTDSGFAVDLDPVDSTITVSETYMGEVAAHRDNISLFQAAWTWNIMGNKNLGLKGSFQNGVLEATAQRSQQWLISLGVKY